MRKCSCPAIRHKECGCKLRRDIQSVGDLTGWINYWCDEHRSMQYSDQDSYKSFKREWIRMIENV